MPEQAILTLTPVVSDNKIGEIFHELDVTVPDNF